MNGNFSLVDFDKNKKISGLTSARIKDPNIGNNKLLDLEKDEISDMYDIGSDEFSIYSYFQDKSSFIDYQKTSYPQNDINSLLKINNDIYSIPNIPKKTGLVSETISNQDIPYYSFDNTSCTLQKCNDKTTEKTTLNESNKKTEATPTNSPNKPKNVISEKLPTNDTKKETSSSGKKEKKSEKTLIITLKNKTAKKSKQKEPENSRDIKSKKEKVTQKQTVKTNQTHKKDETTPPHPVYEHTKPQFSEKNDNLNFQYINGRIHSNPKEIYHRPKQEIKYYDDIKIRNNDDDEFIEVSPIPVELIENDQKPLFQSKRSTTDTFLSQIEHENMIQDMIRDQVLSKAVYEPELFLKAMSSDELFLNPYTLKFEPKNFWVNYNMDLKFREIVNTFFRVNNTRISKFIYKLYNMLLITSKVPLFKAIVGVSWITHRIFSVNVRYFSAMINLAKPQTDAILFGNSNNVFLNYYFIEITPENYMNAGLSEFPNLGNPEIKLMFHGLEKFVNKELSEFELDEIENENRLKNNFHRNKNIINYHSYPAFS